MKSAFWGISITALVSLSSILTACTPGPSDNAPIASSPIPGATKASSPSPVPSPVTAITPKNQMGGMNHDMSHGMDLGPADAEFDLRFLDAMTPHHQGAIVMAQAAKQKSQRPEIQALADSILKAQAQEITQMQQWRQVWYPTASKAPIAYNAKMGHTMPMTAEQTQSMMMTMDLGAANAEFDLRFINAMVVHHQGAVTMAKDALTKAQRPEIKQLSQEIILSQEGEIQQMQQWKQAWFKS